MYICHWPRDVLQFDKGLLKTRGAGLGFGRPTFRSGVPGRVPAVAVSWFGLLITCLVSGFLPPSRETWAQFLASFCSV